MRAHMRPTGTVSAHVKYTQKYMEKHNEFALKPLLIKKKHTQNKYLQ